jgi:hypothetical protein
MLIVGYLLRHPLRAATVRGGRAASRLPLMGKPEFDKSRDERKRVEMRFAHLKTHHRFERMRLRGLSGARDEFHLAAIVQNLKTLANHIWRPPPDAMYAATESSEFMPSPRGEWPNETTAPVKSPSRKHTPLIADFINTIDPSRTWPAAQRPVPEPLWSLPEAPRLAASIIPGPPPVMIITLERSAACSHAAPTRRPNSRATS